MPTKELESFSSNFVQTFFFSNSRELCTYFFRPRHFPIIKANFGAFLFLYLEFDYVFAKSRKYFSRTLTFLATGLAMDSIVVL